MSIEFSQQARDDSDVLYETIYEVHGCWPLDGVNQIGEGWAPGRAAVALAYLLTAGFATLRKFRGRTYVHLANPVHATG